MELFGVQVNFCYTISRWRTNRGYIFFLVHCPEHDPRPKLF